jgi:hypothetical protein
VLVQKVFKSVEWPNKLCGRRPPFIAPKRNLSVGVSEIWICLTSGPDMSGKCYWNLTLALDMSGVET